MKKAVITFGRFNPMTVGHEKLVNKVKDVSKKISGDPHIYLSHTQDKKRNPLDYNTKVKLAQRAFGSAVKKSRARTIIEIMKELEKKKYTDVHLVVGSDRVKEFDTLLQKYNGKDYTFDSIKVESAGDRDPDAEGISGMSATKMRLAAKSDDLPRFKSGAPSKLSDKEIKLMYDKVQAVLEELENITIDDDIFQVSDVEIEAVIEMTELDDEDISEFDIDEAKKPLSVAQRAKIARRMKKMAPKMKMKKALAAKRMATPAQLEKRAKKAAINLVRKKFAGKAGANYASLSPSAKIGVDKIISKKMGAVNKIAKKMMPGIKKKEQERIKALRSKKEEVQMDNNVNEIFNEIMTTRYKGKIVANQIFKTQLKAFAFASKHGGKVIRTGKEFRVTVPRQSGPRSRTWDLDDNAKMSLMQKASRNDIPFEIIQEVFERGLEEYDITPRESQDRVQWGFARVNSFLTNGTRKAVDADLWEQAMDILPEGPNDPAIFKAVFLAGGPGSGKSFIAGKAGLRSFGFKLINPDPAFENALKKAGLEMSAKDIYSKQGQEVRKAARQLTDKQTEMAIHNRLGLLVDGTGKDFNKIAKLKSMVEKKGYESYLLAVNTDLETAIKRNRMRSRKLPDEKVKEMWFAVQNNMDKFGKLFGKNFLAVTNNDEDNPSKQSMIAYKKIGSWSKTPPKSQKAQNWIKAALDARKTRREEVEDNLNEVYVLVHNNRIVDKGNKSQMHLARLKLKKKTGETDHKKLFVGLKGTKTQFADIGAKWKEEVEIKEIYKGKETVAVVKGKPNDIAKARDKLQNSLDTMYNVIGPHNVSVDIDAIDRYVDKLDRLVIKGDRAGAWAMNLVKNNRKLKADYKFDFGSRKQKSGMMKMGEDIQEAILKVDNFDDSKIRRIGRAKSDLKQLGLQMRVQRGQGSEPDSDYAIFKGDEKNLVAYAQKWLGTTSDNLEDCQSDLDGNTNLLANEKTPDEKFENLMEDQYTRVLDAIGKHLNHRAYMAALDVYKKKTVGKKDPHRSMTATKIAQTFRGVEPKPFVDFINSLIDKGKLPREIHARYTDTSMYEQAEYQGKKVKLNDPIRTDENPNKKFKVYVKNENDEVVVVRFGDPNMDIKRDDAGSRASFRARHNCDNPGPKWKARYWSCYQWRANAPVNNEFTPDEKFEQITEEVTAVKNKADDSGMPYSILKKVYDRGMGAYKTSHRPGTTPQQWAMARVNSFIKKSPGTWGKADADLAKQVRKENVDEGSKAAAWAKGDADKNKLISLYNKAIDYPPHSPKWEKVMKEIGKLRKQMKLREDVQISLNDGAVSGDKKTRLIALYHKAFELEPKSPAFMAVQKEISKLRKKLNMKEEKMKTFKEHRELDEAPMDMKKRLQAFNKLKPNQEVEVSFDSAMKKGVTAKFKVGRKTKVSGGKIEKITMQRLGKDGRPGGVKHFLYNRGGNVSMAIGDLAATLTNIK